MNLKKINKREFWLFNIVTVKQFIFLIIFLFLFTSLGSYLVYAKSKYKIYDLEISAYSPNNISISFFTPWNTPSEIQISKTHDFKNPQSYYDLRSYKIDSTLGGLTYRKEHIFNITNLDPETQYYFNIKTKYNLKYQKEVYSFKTTKVLDNLREPMPLYGKFTDENNNIPSSLLLKLQAYKDEQPISSSLLTYTNLNGNYYFDLSNLYAKDFSEKLDLDEKTILKITASDGNNKHIYSISKNEIAPVKTLKFVINNVLSTSTSIYKNNQNIEELYTKFNGQNELSYELEEGWNSLTFPLYKTSNIPYSASDLIQTAASQNVEITEISRWYGSWDGYVKRDGEIYGEDFLLNPNEGYFIKSSTKSILKLNGFAPNNADSIKLLNGWTLIGIPSNIVDNNINARNLIEILNKKYTSIYRNIARFEDGDFNTLSVEEGSDGKKSEFGLNFNIDKREGYFIFSSEKNIFSF